METRTLRYEAKNGWSEPFPAMDSASTVVMVFGASSFLKNTAPLKALAAAYPNSHVMGCSTSGEILDTFVYDDSLVVAVTKFANTSLRSTQATLVDMSDSYATGEELANNMVAADLKWVFVLAVGVNINGSELVRGIEAALPDEVVVTGGLAGDGDRFESTWVQHGDTVTDNQVVALGVYGPHVEVYHGSKGGWDIFGPERRITKADANILYELDDQPALELYKTYLGDLATGLPATALLFPLAIRQENADAHQIVRTVLGVDESNNSMTFAGDMPVGAMAQLMKADFERLIDGATDAAQMMRTPGSGDDRATLAIAISCVGRRLVLGERTEEELEATMEVLPKGTMQIGFYSYGEISPYLDMAAGCELHNQTMTLTTIREHVAS